LLEVLGLELLAAFHWTALADAGWMKGIGLPLDGGLEATMLTAKLGV